MTAIQLLEKKIARTDKIINRLLIAVVIAYLGALVSCVYALTLVK